MELDDPGSPDPTRTRIGPRGEKLEELLDAFTARLLGGEQVSISEYIKAAPEMGDRIRELFAAVQLLGKGGEAGAAGGLNASMPGALAPRAVLGVAIRFVVIDRLVTQGTRSERGRRWCERIWTVMATCAQKGRSSFNFILETIESYFANRPTPSLLHLEPAPIRSG